MTMAPPRFSSTAVTDGPAKLAAIVIMGVSGVGKTTIGQMLAARLAMTFVDADDLHPPENVAKMRAGVALDDADRAPWLARVRAAIDEARSQGRQLVMACSALKRCYRQDITHGAPDVAIIWLAGAPELIRERMQARHGHFMTAAMLDSQLATLEPPEPDEHVVAIDIDAPPEIIVERIVVALRDLV